MMRIVTWNMGCGPPPSPYRKHHNDAWDYLFRNLNPDVALIQEALVMKYKEARDTHSVTVCGLGPSTDAGTAVLVRGLQVNEAPPNIISPHTYLATIELETPAGSLIVMSIHPFPGNHLHTDLKLLVKLLTCTHAGRIVLVGGDFNASRLFDKPRGMRRNQNFFTAMDEAGFYEAHWGIHGHEVQSVWTKRTTKPYQNDHFFITKAWAPRVHSCDVIDNEVVRRVSDHGPLVLELDMGTQ